MTGEHPFIDTSDWPIVHIRIPEVIDQEDGAAHLRGMQAILDRSEPYVIIFEGPERPRSPEFNRDYMKWYKSTKDVQKKLCCGLVRVEEEGDKRSKVMAMAKNYIAKAAIPYPYEVCGSFEEAETIAREMLARGRTAD